MSRIDELLSRMTLEEKSSMLAGTELWYSATVKRLGIPAFRMADVLFDDFPFTGKLSYSWPGSNEQLSININHSASKSGCDAPLFSFGHGLTYEETAPQVLECPK